LFPVIDIINHYKGQITVDTLAKNSFTSVRQLERNFKQHIGTGPKEFINFVRYETAIRYIRRYAATRSLQDIAYDTGYYDHAHLTNEIKRYTGLAPSQL
jgi:AraC-like DNA-binding protein